MSPQKRRQKIAYLRMLMIGKSHANSFKSWVTDEDFPKEKANVESLRSRFAQNGKKMKPKIRNASNLKKTSCCVFQPAFGCCVHRNSGQNTFWPF